MRTFVHAYRHLYFAAVFAICIAGIYSVPVANGAITYVKTWGSTGGTAGQFNSPTGIAVGAAGQVYIADSNNNRIERFDSNGTYQTSFGTLGNGTGQFRTPVSVAVNSSGQVYVGSYGNGNYSLGDGSGIERFDSNGVYQRTFDNVFYITGNYNYHYLPPHSYGLAISATGQVYAADTNLSQIDRFDANGGLQGSFAYSATSAANGAVSQPWGVAVNTAGQLYVADTGNNRVQRFDSSNNFQLTFGSLGNLTGLMNNPTAIAVSSNGNVYVVDSNNNRVQRFDGSGGFETSFGSTGNGSGQFTSPNGIAVSPTGEIFVTDGSNNRVEKFFDPTEWVSGSPHFDSAAVGNGQLLGASVSMNSSQGLQVDGALTVQVGGTLTQQATTILAASFSNSGQFNTYGGTLNLGGGTGTMVNNATAILAPAAIGGSVTNNYGATLNASGSISGNLLNNGTFTQNGILSVSGTVTNAGNSTITAGQQLAPGAMTNSGIVGLAGGAIIGSGNLTNTAAGAIRGDGAITMTLTNQGGLIYANGTNGLTISSFVSNRSGGELRVADGDTLNVLGSSGPSWTNSGTVSLKGANAALTGDTINNNGSIVGQGRVTNTINNLVGGTIRADNGLLQLDGANISNFQGTIRSATGTSIVVSQGLASNSGLIALTGGSFDNNGYPLYNGSSILGNGTFSTGGLANFGTASFSDGNSSILGDVTNGGTINTYGANSTIISFYGAVVNSASYANPFYNPAGHIKINGNTVRWLGGLTNNGVYISDPADNYFTGLAVGSSGVLQGGVGDRFFVTGSFTNAGQIVLGGTSTMLVGNGTGTLTQTAGVLHLGSSATLSAGTVEIDGGSILADGPGAVITSSLIYDSPTTSIYQGVLKGAGNNLLVNNPNALLILSGSSNSYTGGTYVEAGMLIIDGVGSLPASSSLTLGSAAPGVAFVLPSAQSNDAVLPAVAPVPEPGTFGLLVIGAFGLLAMYRRRL